VPPFFVQDDCSCHDTSERNSKGSVFFFTAVLADRSSRLLVDEIDRLRICLSNRPTTPPFETIAICVLPDPIHAVWALPERDADFPPLELDQERLLARLVALPRSASKARKREKGIVATSLLGTRHSR